MKPFLFSLLILILVSCSHSNKALEIKLAAVDSVAIKYYRGDGTEDSIVKVIVLKSPADIKALRGFMNAVETSEMHCGVDGSLHFFKSNAVIQDVDFRFNDKDCMRFSFFIEGKHYNTQLSAEAKNYLQALK